MSSKNKLFVVWLMLSLFGCMAVIICLAFILYHFAMHRPKFDPGYNFEADALILRQEQDYWVSHGRPQNFQPGEWSGNENHFTYTNIVNTTNGVLHCRFGARRPSPNWPEGVLAMTDEGAVIFIRERDGKVIFSPEKNGVEY